MNIQDLRQIGQNVFEELSGFRQVPGERVALGTGAAGDKYFAVDKKAEEIILAGLEKLDLPLTAISEEAGVVEIRGGSNIRAVIDPVDGSKNAVSGIPLYCTSIAVSEGEKIGDIIMGYVINIVTGDEFWAEKNKGAFYNGRRMRAQVTPELDLALYEAQSPRRDIEAIIPLLGEAKKTRCLGSTALDLAYVALGTASVFISPSLSRSFDFSGGLLLVKESGGIVTNTEGDDISDIVLGLKRTSTLLASGNPDLHNKALGVLRRMKQSV